MIIFQVVKSPNYNIGRVTTKPLVVTEAAISAILGSIKTSIFPQHNYSIDFHLYATLFSLRRGVSQGYGFQLNIDPSDADLKKLVAENFGMCSGALLSVRDLGVTWDNIFPIFPYTFSNSANRPDFICWYGKDVSIIECKGTTDSINRASRSIEKAKRQIQNFPFSICPVRDSYAFSAYVPLAGSPSPPTLWAADPDHGGGNGENLESTSTIWLEKIRLMKIACFAGFPNLANLIYGESDNEKILTEMARLEIEKAEKKGRMYDSLPDVKFVGRVIGFSDLVGSIDSQFISGANNISIGIDQKMAYRMLEYRPGDHVIPSYRENIYEENLACLSNGLAVSIENSSNGSKLVSRPT